MSPVKGPIKVLLVDEDRDYLNLTKRILDRVPEFSVETTPSPSEALMIIDDSIVDAVVSDYQMPEMSGLELLREVRGRHGDLPFIILTGRSREEVAIEALNLGADFYLQKGLDPLQVTELTNMIRQTVKRRWAEKAMRDSDALHRLILDSSSAAISVNVEGKIEYANRKRAELTGNPSPEELNGQDSMLAVHPDDLEALLSRQGARRRGERTEPNFSFRAVRKP